MKKVVALILCVLLMLTLVACGEGSATKMTMGTGGTSGTYYGYGGILGNQIKTSTGITVNVVSTDGSKANILGIDAGNYQLATVQSDVMAYAYAGPVPLKPKAHWTLSVLSAVSMPKLFSLSPWTRTLRA